MTSPRSPLGHRLATAARVSAGIVIFAAGTLVAGAFTSSAPAAPQDCLPAVGCLTTTVPIVSVPVTLPTVPTLPGITPTTTTTATGGSTTNSTATTTDSTESTTVSQKTAAFNPKARVRVRGRGARRVVEIRVTLTKAARLDALLSRNRNSIARKLFTAKAGRRIFRLRIGRTAKPGLANLSLVYRAATGEAARTKHRLRLPR